MNLIFFSKKLVPRIEYTVKHLFGRVLGYSVEFTSDESHFITSEKIRIQYGSQPIATTAYFIPTHHFMLEGDIRHQEIDFDRSQELPAFFFVNQKGADLPFDFIAMAFFLISRYEEYLSFQADKHGRFTANQSLAFKYQFLHQPLIDQWLIIINEHLSNRFHISISKSHRYAYIPTIDIDFAWAYLHKNKNRTVGGCAKDLLTGKLMDLSKRIAVLRGKQTDPYDTFDFLNALHKSNECEACYFILFGEYGPFDKNNAPDHPAMIHLVGRLAAKNEIGIHPSYASNSATIQLKKEKEALSEVSGQFIHKSRQHFLKLSFPKTYRELLNIGIRSDYTMGYAEEVGFRASTCHPFFWYDLENEKETTLEVIPFQIMDVTLKNYMKLTPEMAIEVCQNIIESVQKVDGTLVSIWHNSSFSSLMGWDAWRPVYEKFVTMASKTGEAETRN